MHKRDMELQSDSCPMEPMAQPMLSMRIATVGNIIQTDNSPIYEYEYFW